MIGFFDSGVGGLTIEQAARKAMPEYDFLYLGDSAHAPYGNKSKEEIVEYTLAGVNWLIERGCTLVILACNSASAQALRDIQQTHFSPSRSERVLGIIRPTAEFFATTPLKNLVVFSTPTTAQTGAYQAEMKHFSPETNVLVHGCANWAPMIERGLAQTDEMREEVVRDVNAARDELDFDSALLACTHFPYVRNFVEEAVGSSVAVYDQAELVVKSLRDYLERHLDLEKHISKNGTSSYYVTGDAAAAMQVAKEQFGYEIRFEEVESER